MVPGILKQRFRIPSLSGIQERGWPKKRVKRRGVCCVCPSLELRRLERDGQPLPVSWPLAFCSCFFIGWVLILVTDLPTQEISGLWNNHNHLLFAIFVHIKLPPSLKQSELLSPKVIFFAKVINSHKCEEGVPFKLLPGVACAKLCSHNCTLF